MKVQTTGGLVTQFFTSEHYNFIINPIVEENTFSPGVNVIIWESWTTPEITQPIWQQSVFISTLHDSHLKLREQITVFIEYDGYQFIAYAADLDIYGYGDIEYEAVEDLRQSIVELYFDLKGEKLAPSLKKIWNYLNSIVEESENPRS